MQKLESATIVKFEEKGQSLTGTFVNEEESTEYPGSFLVTVKNQDGINQGAFVSTIVTDLLKQHNVLVGELISIAYKGKQKTKDGKREYKAYDVFVDRK